ncbi:sensor protein KdpD [mine drainage metagenome]|uniref:histidine kinase n=1 Tax=mine drainage metagenome TaxID=410659 RepID=A0A1J5QWD7_9ZZZZ
MCWHSTWRWMPLAETWLTLADMTDQRPNPDELLEKMQREKDKARRGKLKLFFGASAGVGKTYAMLAAARQLRAQGVDVVIGVVETHGRKETQAMVEGLEQVAPREISYRDRVLTEFDLDGALSRKPELILVDELAHSNVAGSRHPKRWQDVEELLAAGIDVCSTVNVQHLETLNDIVSGITGINVWETVPDRIFVEADEVALVDLPPDELLQRLKEGKVYLPQQAERAIQNFFRKGNLIALRELALRRTADRVDVEMQQYRRDLSVGPVWKARESILACIGAGDGGDRIVRSAARLAGLLDVPWHVVYIETPELQGLPDAKRDRILKTLKMAQDMSAETASLAGNDACATAVEYARLHNLSILMAGRDHPRPWSPWRRSFADRVGASAPDLDVIQVSRSESDDRHGYTPPLLRRQIERLENDWRDYAMAALGCAAVTLIAAPLSMLFDLSNIVMLFLLTVVIVALRYGRGPAVLASFLSVPAFDFFYVPPRFSFAISDVQYLMTFITMLVVGLITGQLTAGLKYQARIATSRESRVRALYEMSRDLSGALITPQIAEICGRFIESQFGAKASIILSDLEDNLKPPMAATARPPVIDHGIAQWAFDHEEAAGNGTDTLPGSPVLYLPLKAPMRVRGVFAFEPVDPGHLMTPEQRRLLETFARLIAIALERIHYVDIAQSTTVKMESERLRNSLLSAISHDLRTPLSVLVGLADSMALTKPPLTGQQMEIAATMRLEAMRMTALVNNLLDMARLQAGEVRLDRQWCPLEEIVGSSLRAMSSILVHHKVNVRLDENLPLLEIDAVLMERVLCNLLENAAKYTPQGTEIEIGALVAGQEVSVWVEDNGPGLPAGKEEVIFNKFERGQKENATPGVGLGLAICRAIIEAHGGGIHAENRRPSGARFVFTLPKGNPPAIEAETVGPERKDQ